ncbi:plasmid pRiA4b ORF-3 family protein [Chitinophaga silvisoli]|uniref:Plasmid pRiA4b ORF-3 family protein n=1 Tax=Chitinophaga silvisoli TaxID=2291814 RepID=A0A3E1NSL6_9BACT|nr:plasmid pRiA4b ORF-3 family protein [Chitinophaga silvisoli]
MIRFCGKSDYKITIQEKRINWFKLIYKFHITLLESDPLVWRQIVVPADYTFYQLHMTIQAAFGWENNHLFQFSQTGLMDKICYGLPGDDIDPEITTIDARKTKVSRIFKKEGQTYCYVYDFGDEWNHKILLEGIEAKDMNGPYCLDGGGACPPEDVGGLSGYYEMVKILKTKNHPEKAEYIQWLGLVSGEKWDEKLCSIRETNKRLLLLAK